MRAGIPLTFKARKEMYGKLTIFDSRSDKIEMIEEVKKWGGGG